MINHQTFYNHKLLIDFWHNIFKRYIPIKKEIIIQVNEYKKKLFGFNSNILGILMRGTDYISRKPRFHPIPPKISDALKDTKEMDMRYNYDYFFLSTEDSIIRQKFIKEFPRKLKNYKTINITIV